MSNLFIVSSLYFHRQNSNWDMIFFNSSWTSKLGFFNVGLGLLKFYFLIHKKKKKSKICICWCCCSWISQFFPLHEIDEMLIFECLLRLYFLNSPNSLMSWKIGIFKICLLLYFLRMLGYSFKLGTWVKERESIFE